MPFDPLVHHRRSIRLKGYDYSQPGAYFITICSQPRACQLGNIMDGAMLLNECGLIAEATWKTIPELFPSVALDAFIVMPDHLHGILIFNECMNPIVPEQQTAPVGARFIAPDSATVPLQNGGTRLFAPNSPSGPSDSPFPILLAPTLGSVVRTYKGKSTRAIRTATSPEFAWQRNYYEHIVRDEKSIEKLRRYIWMNPVRWADGAIE